jgi:ferredoxin
VSEENVMRIRVTDGGTAACRPGTSVLRALIAAGRRDIPLGCRSGGCGVCRIRVESGRYTVGPMSAAEVDATDVATGIALACRTHPLTDVRITVLGRRPRTFPNPDQENP